MKIHQAILFSALADTSLAGKNGGKGNKNTTEAAAPECPKCDDVINTFNDWHGNDHIICSRYQDPRDQFDPRGACKECKIKCVPSEEKCPGITDLKAGFWWRTGVKIMDQYVERAAEQSEQREQAKLEQRRKNNFAKEQAKYEKELKKKQEREEKAANKAAKAKDWEAWRENKRQENEAKRAQRKQEKKERKAAAKAAKEYRKKQREAKRLLAEQQKTMFAFYADLEENYESVCPDMFLIENNQFEFNEEQHETY